MGQVSFRSRVGFRDRFPEARQNELARIELGHGDDGALVARARISLTGIGDHCREITDLPLGLRKDRQFADG